jgi:hypothetical protein
MRNVYAYILSIRQIFLNEILLSSMLSLNPTELTYKTIPIASIIFLENKDNYQEHYLTTTCHLQKI